PAGKTAPANRRRYLIAAMAIGALMLLAAIALLFSSGRNETGSATSLASIPKRSMAVLPFENLSDDKSNAYFTDGIQDEILTRLSKIAALKVISRTST